MQRKLSMPCLWPPTYIVDISCIIFIFVSELAVYLCEGCTNSHL